MTGAKGHRQTQSRLGIQIRVETEPGGPERAKVGLLPKAGWRQGQEAQEQSNWEKGWSPEARSNTGGLG